MSFRKEDKLLINPYQIFDFKCWLVNNDAKQIFPARFINSLYFDNLLSQMFLDSEEGCVPRKKIRIRTYPKQEENKKINLEIKISSVEGRYKETNEDFEIPSHDDTLMGLHRLVKRGVVEITGGPQPQYQLSIE